MRPTAPPSLLDDPPSVCLSSNDAYDIRDVVVELAPQRQQPGTVIWTRDDAIAPELAAKNLNLDSEEPNAGVAANGIRFN
jgi:hypothetical protein